MLWEAQFGDFVNGAQIILDQFVVAGLSKWSETLRLVLLLPHGYEGNGPEHSSARLERFLQSTAQDNIRVANPSTAAQFFHLLRRQALEPVARPLVVMTPKGLLRLREAASTLADLADGSFQPVIDDPGADRDAHAPARPLLGQGLLRHRRARAARRRRDGRRRPARAAVSLPEEPSSPRSSLPTRIWPRSSGRRRSRRTWARGARSGTVWRRRCRPAFRSATSAGPGARARARATRPRTSASRTGSPARRWAVAESFRLRDAAAAFAERAACGRDQRAVPLRVGEKGLALPRRKAKPDVVGRERKPDGASGSTQFRHTSILTYGPRPSALQAYS